MEPSGPGPTTGFIFFVEPQRKRTKRNGFHLAVGISITEAVICLNVNGADDPGPFPWGPHNLIY
jgi:hypothetical protein